jgi:hypothetical protein
MPAHLVIPDDKTHREEGNRKIGFFTNKTLMRHLLFIGQSDKSCYNSNKGTNEESKVSLPQPSHWSLSNRPSITSESE